MCYPCAARGPPGHSFCAHLHGWWHGFGAEADYSCGAENEKKSRTEVERAGAVTAEYCSLTGQQLNVKKSLSFHVNGVAAETPLRLQGELVKVVEAAARAKASTATWSVEVKQSASLDMARMNQRGARLLLLKMPSRY